MSVPTEHLLVLAAILFGLGVLGFLSRRNVIIVLASIELMLNAANLTFVAGSRAWAAEGVTGGHPIQGPIFAIFVILVAAAEAAIGLAILVVYFRNRGTIAVEDINLMKG